MSGQDADDGPVALARAYYRALDEDDYDLLVDVLATEFVHERPDMTLDGRDRFVRFMREERPQTDTTHPIDAIYVRAETVGDGGATTSENGGDGATEVVVRGRLLAADRSEITAFVDVFRVADGHLVHLRTFTD